MMPNMFIIALAALVPLIVGFIWYSKKVFGNAWITASGLTEEKLQGANMPIILILSYVFGLMLAMALLPIVIHQAHIMSILMNEPGIKDVSSEVNTMYTEFMAKYGTNFRTFKHGVFHGILAAIFIGLPIVGTSALFERRGFKYIAIHVGYWIVTMGIMGGIICQFS